MLLQCTKQHMRLPRALDAAAAACAFVCLRMLVLNAQWLVCFVCWLCQCSSVGHCFAPPVLKHAETEALTIVGASCRSKIYAYALFWHPKPSRMLVLSSCVYYTKAAVDLCQQLELCQTPCDRWQPAGTGYPCGKRRKRGSACNSCQLSQFDPAPCSC